MPRLCPTAVLIRAVATVQGTTSLSLPEFRALLLDPRSLLRAPSSGRPPLGFAQLTCRAGLALLVVVHILCLLGATFPLLDVLNHFQPFIALASLALLAAAWRSNVGVEIAWYALLAATNVMLLLAPVLRLPTHVLAPPAGEQLKLVTFNYLYWQQRHGDVVAFIHSTNPDLVVFQEVTGLSKQKLDTDLAAAYPFRFFCERCDVAILSKRRLTSVREVPRLRANAYLPLVVATIRSGTRDIWLAGVHLQNPETPFLQAEQLAILTRQLAAINGPLIVAGDLNLTPWSWSLNRFSTGVGLRRHTGILGTWSTSRGHLLPWFPIDHVLTTSDIGLVAIERGPVLGSDHLPVIATLVLPPN